MNAYYECRNVECVSSNIVDYKSVGTLFLFFVNEFMCGCVQNTAADAANSLHAFSYMDPIFQNYVNELKQHRFYNLKLLHVDLYIYLIIIIIHIKLRIYFACC